MEADALRGRLQSRGVVALGVALVVGLALWLIVANAAPSTPVTVGGVHATATPTIGIGKTYSLPTSLTGYRLLVTDLLSGDVGDLGNMTLILGGGPHGVIMQPGGRYAWVTNSSGSNVWVLDLTARGPAIVVGSIVVGPSPVHV